MNPVLRSFLLICAGLGVAFYAQTVLDPQVEFPWIIFAMLCLGLWFKSRRTAAVPPAPPQGPATLESLERQLAATAALRWLPPAVPQTPPALPQSSGPWGASKP
jgi:hypothetical protein